MHMLLRLFLVGRVSILENQEGGDKAVVAGEEDFGGGEHTAPPEISYC